MGDKDESGATATVVFIRNDVMFISHIGDSCVVSSNSCHPCLFISVGLLSLSLIIPLSI